MTRATQTIVMRRIFVFSSACVGLDVRIIIFTTSFPTRVEEI